MPFKQKVEKQEEKRSRNGITVDILQSVDIQEIERCGETVNDIYGGVIYKDNSTYPPFRRLVEKLFL